MDEFTVSATASDSAVRATVAGDVDLATAERLREAVTSEVRPGVRVDLDCSGVSFLDSAGVRVLLELNRTAREAGGGLVLVAPSEVVVRILDLAGVAGLFALRPPAVS
ncbi:STAS domain-containing protein [Catenulispora subtropica]|uniref:Anti-sigma factor antagonist n=1 Tax=Catenulispora subtropica TaxID=450798 RepID=A0ABP5EPA1_9ACTN